VTLTVLDGAVFQSSACVGNGEGEKESDQDVQKTWHGHQVLQRTERTVVRTRDDQQKC
jgi:hypothetical protein